ncbi:MAG TPA: TetR/AcrR family transcriptional regulator [Pseudonocardia sp.]|uniref:TetR/AcrR family transcriptional regulator n=1 Tax=Pseudonocardia sp. TaxID=60912 RepID=UPI002C1C0625|nr:TetR/AcrR family transcriptional regulator [Pseudonocardia sp.]HTF51438.1 TetR/AcrR family transcriptional regulator [Pseudonocardia sp.]
MNGALRTVSDWRTFSPSLDLDPVLGAAAKSFVTLGYHGTTMREIARQADLSVPGLYHHYPSKQHMLVAVLDAALADLRWRLDAADVEGAGDPALRLELLVSALVLYHCHRRGLGLIAASEMRSVESASRRRIAARRTEVQRLVDTAVLDGAARGLFRTRYPLDASRAVVTMSVSVAAWFQMALTLTPEDVAERYVDYALSLVRYREPAHPR